METVGHENGLKREILDTARHLLVRDGYANLSMRKIAREIGRSATSIYLHFDSKDALVHTLIDEGMELLYTRLDEARSTGRSPLGKLEALAQAYVRFGLEYPEYYEAMFMLHPERMERYPPEKYRSARRNLELIASVLAEGAQTGSIGAEDPALTATLIWAALHGAVSLMIAHRIDIRIDQNRLVGEVVERLLASVTTQKQEA